MLLLTRLRVSVPLKGEKKAGRLGQEPTRIRVNGAERYFLFELPFFAVLLAAGFL